MTQQKHIVHRTVQDAEQPDVSRIDISDAAKAKGTTARFNEVRLTSRSGRAPGDAGSAARDAQHRPCPWRCHPFTTLSTLVPRSAVCGLLVLPHCSVTGRTHNDTPSNLSRVRRQCSQYGCAKSCRNPSIRCYLRRVLHECCADEASMRQTKQPLRAPHAVCGMLRGYRLLSCRYDTVFWMFHALLGWEARSSRSSGNLGIHRQVLQGARLPGCQPATSQSRALFSLSGSFSICILGRSLLTDRKPATGSRATLAYAVAERLSACFINGYLTVPSRGVPSSAHVVRLSAWRPRIKFCKFERGSLHRWHRSVANRQLAAR